MPNGCNVLALFIIWASRAFRTECPPGNTDVLSRITNNSAQVHTHHHTLAKLAILLTTSASSRLNSYAAMWLSTKGSGGSFNKQSQNITSVWHKQKRWNTPVMSTSDTYLLTANQSLSRIVLFLFKFIFVTVFFSHTFFPLSSWERFVLQTEI